MKTQNKFKELVVFLKDLDSPLGDLCTDILDDKTFPIDNEKEALSRVAFLGSYYTYLKDPVTELIAIYKKINKT